MFMTSMDESELTKTINDGIDILLRGMEKDGVISGAQFKEMMRYRIVMHSPGVWGNIWSKLFKNTDNKNAVFYSAVRLTHTEDDLPDVVK